MVKGQVAVGIIAIAVIAVIAVIVFLYYKPNTNGGGTKYKNDIITVEKSTVSNSNPYPGSTTSISIIIKNNGDKKTSEYSPDGVEVNFDNIAGLNFKGLECEGGRQISHSCIFDSLDPMDTRAVVLTLEVPEESVRNPFVEYFVKYTYTGFRKADIPIVEDSTRTPLSKFSQSSTSLGPITMEFEFPAQRETRVDNQVIKEYLVVGSNPFELKVKIKHVGTVANVEPTKIEPNNIILDLRNNFRKETSLRCDFDESGGKLYSTEEVEVPEELKCNLVFTLDPNPETLGSIWGEITYDYQFRRKETFTVKELPKT